MLDATPTIRPLSRLLRPPGAPAEPPAPRFDLPPILHTAAGTLRRVGVEAEFTGLSAGAAARALTDALGGTLVPEDAHAFAAQGTRLGDFAVELDIRHLHPGRREPSRLPRLGARGAAWVGWALARLVPCELVTAPMPIDRLAEIDQAIAVLRRAGAAGSGATAFASLGLHFNVEMPDLHSRTITAVLKAFLLMEPHLRRVATGAKPFPESYARRVVAPDYWPDLPQLAEDYLAANPTRDRGLDLLPVFLHLDEGRVRSRLPFEKIRPRTAFHYRLPFAFVGDPAWSIAPDWNRWVAVERLAADPAALTEFGNACLRFQGTPDQWADLIAPPGARC